MTIPGFGTFEPRERSARTGRNPQTGAEIQIAASTVPGFKAGAKFKAAVSGKLQIRTSPRAVTGSCEAAAPGRPVSAAKSPSRASRDLALGLAHRWDWPTAVELVETAAALGCGNLPWLAWLVAQGGGWWLRRSRCGPSRNPCSEGACSRTAGRACRVHRARAGTADHRCVRLRSRFGHNTGIPICIRGFRDLGDCRCPVAVLVPL